VRGRSGPTPIRAAGILSPTAGFAAPAAGSAATGATPPGSARPSTRPPSSSILPGRSGWVNASAAGRSVACSVGPTAAVGPGPSDMERERITIAILGLGGQGGGVLANWIVQLGEKAGLVSQGTSVPGTAQRTGSTVYYVEMMPKAGAVDPVLALMPVPGDVNIVIAAELMEAGRAILRGFVTRDRTTLIAS